MKQHLQLFFALSLLLFGSLLYSCGSHDRMMNNQPAAESAKTAQTTDVYACPMHPEITGKAGDTCSKCGMALEKVEKADYACPMHPEVTGHKGDNCSKCGMPLKPIKQ